MKKKKLIVVILGVKMLHPRAHWIKKFIHFIFNALHVTSFFDYKHQLDWKRHFEDENSKVIYLHWGRGISRISRFFAVRKLENIIHQYKNSHEITLIGHSMGGEVALEAARKFDGIIKKAILLFSANTRTKVGLKKTKVVNVYSPYDLFVRFAIKILAPIMGGQKLIGDNISNIALEHFEHEEVFSDKKINNGRFRGRTIPELIRSFI